MTASPVQPASAAMPSEGDVARALCIADGKDPDFDYDPLGLGRPAGTDLRWRCYLSQARAVLALFAPILAEKEARIREMAMQALADDQQLTVSLDRALAAEAALAAERERCAKVADDNADNDSRGDCPWDGGAGGMGYRLACYDIAAAIRAQGE